MFLSKWTAALDDSVPGRANACMSLFSDFPFTFNAGWSAGKCPGFTVTEVSLAPRCHPFILADVAQRLSFCSLLPAGLVKNLGWPWRPRVASSSPSAGAGGAGVRVSAGSTVGVNETAVWVPNEHGLTEGVLAHVAQLLV